ncbi:MAG TPA: Uma2 family endonuclease [Allocoleopsis sp.]
MSTQSIIAEQRVLIHNINWQLFESLLDAMGNNNSSRISYDKGTLEFMSPLWFHENVNRLIDRLIIVLLEEMELEYNLAGSLTLKRADMVVGKEPDSCYYIQNAAKIRGKINIDLSIDPPPDLAIEIDISRSSLNQLEIYGKLGVGEVWIYDGNNMRFYHLENQQYINSERSLTFPILYGKKVIEYLSECQTIGVPLAVQNIKLWIQKQNSQK